MNNNSWQEKLLNFQRKRALLLSKKVKVYEAHPLIFYRPNERQREFHKAGEIFKERLFLAGNRCGKTYCGAMEMAMHLTGLYPSWWQGRRFAGPVNAWTASVSVEATRDILQRIYLGDESQNKAGVIPASLIIEKKKRRGVADAVDQVYIRHSSGGVSLLGFKSYDQGREKFQGTSKDFIHLDEEPEIALYEECLLRTMDSRGSIILTMTPLKGMTTLCHEFLQTERDAHITRASWEDATHLSTEEQVRLRKALRPHEREAREKGVPTLGRGRVFPIREEDICVERFPIPPHYKQVFGLDFGWTNPTAAVWLAYDAEKDIVYITDVYTVAERSPQEHVAAIQAKGKWIPGVCDPAGQAASQTDGVSLLERYASHGLYLHKAENNVEAGLMELLERMQTGRLKVFAHLEPWWREFRIYRRGENGQVVKRDDHLMDATRYAVMSGLSLATAQGVQRTPQRPASDWRVV